MSKLFIVTKAEKKRAVVISDNANLKTEYDFLDNCKSSYSVYGKSKEIHFEKTHHGVLISIYCREDNTTASFLALDQYVKGIAEYLTEK